MAVMTGQRVTYRTYTADYSRAMEDRTDYIERERHGTVTSVAKNHVKVRDDASGRVVNVLNHRIVGR